MSETSLPGEKEQGSIPVVKLTSAGDHFAVFDEILGEEALAIVRARVVKLDYRSHSTTVIDPVWRRYDGGQLIGPRFGLEGQPPISDLSPELADSLLQLAAHAETLRLVGPQGRDWHRISVTPWVYPQGTLLSMHQDGDIAAGAFSFYIHESWPIRWGGWLAVMHVGDDDSFDLALSEDRARAQNSADYSYGVLIIPVPNRLVVLSPEARHLISRVDTAAGDRLRMSLNGAFHPSSGA